MYYSLFFLFFARVFIPAETNQYLVLVYDYTFQKYESDPNSFVSTQALLLVSGNKSVYIDEAKLTRDTLTQSLRESQLSGQEKIARFLSIDKPKFNYSVQKEYNTRTMAYSDDINNTVFTYQEDFPTIDWKIGADTTRILNYLCQQATGNFAGRQYEAWFSSDFPVSDGPYKFIGLPGLIMRLKDTEEKFTFNIKGIEVRENLKIPAQQTKNIVTKENFQNRQDHYHQNGLEYRHNRGQRTITANGKPITEAEFYERLKMKYLDRVRIEKE